MASEKILLGYGVVTVDDVPIGLTRGGSVFMVEREYRQIEADGDYGPVEGRTVIDREVVMLTVNALSLFTAAQMNKYYPAIDVTAGKMTSTLAIVAGDSSDVKWIGKTHDGKAVTITVENAINLGNIEWNLEDKNEVVPSLEFTGQYLEEAREVAPWSVEFVDGDTQTVTFTISDSGGVVEGAEVTFNHKILTTNASGVAAFTNVPEGLNKQYKVVKGGYTTYFGAVDVDGAEAVAVTIVAS